MYLYIYLLTRLFGWYDIEFRASNNRELSYGELSKDDQTLEVHQFWPLLLYPLILCLCIIRELSVNSVFN